MLISLYDLQTSITTLYFHGIICFLLPYLSKGLYHKIFERFQFEEFENTKRFQKQQEMNMNISKCAHKSWDILKKWKNYLYYIILYYFILYKSLKFSCRTHHRCFDEKRVRSMKKPELENPVIMAPFVTHICICT